MGSVVQIVKDGLGFFWIFISPIGSSFFYTLAQLCGYKIAKNTLKCFDSTSIAKRSIAKRSIDKRSIAKRNIAKRWKTDLSIPDKVFLIPSLWAAEGRLQTNHWNDSKYKKTVN